MSVVTPSPMNIYLHIRIHIQNGINNDFYGEKYTFFLSILIIISQIRLPQCMKKYDNAMMKWTTSIQIMLPYYYYPFIYCCNMQRSNLGHCYITAGPPYFLVIAVFYSREERLLYMSIVHAYILLSHLYIFFFVYALRHTRRALTLI